MEYKTPFSKEYVKNAILTNWTMGWMGLWVRILLDFFFLFDIFFSIKKIVTFLPSPAPIIAEVGASISRMPGPPRGPS